MRDLPVDALSVSAMRTLRMCSEKWRRRYLEREYEPSSGRMLLGKVFGAAEAQSDHQWIESGEPLDTGQVLDAYAEEFDLAAGEDVDWQGDKPEKLKDSGAKVIEVYHATVPSLPAPVDAERAVRFEVEDVPFVSYLDVEREDGAVEDRKLIGRKMSRQAADSDQQASAYLAGRRAEGNPASRFVFDTAVRKAQPETERVETSRTEDELDHFLRTILGAADEIQWRMESDTWSFAPPGAYWCGQGSCGYWDSCPAGGLLRRRAAETVRSGA